jgi:hypothetical protein
MPLLLNVLRNANTSEYRKLRAKAMECAGLIGMLETSYQSAVCHSLNSQPSRSDVKFSELMRGLSLNFSSEYKVRISNDDRCEL